MNFKLLFTALIGFVSIASIAQADLTLEDAVMNQYRRYYPAHTPMVNWIPNTKNYTYLSADYQTLKMSDAKKKTVSDLISTATLKDLTNETFRYVNVLEWKNGNSFYTASGSKYYLINPALKTSKELGVLPEGAENGTLCSGNDHIAYTIDNNLYVQTPKNEQLQVTNLDKSIVSGQAIARSEFGITNGIFWSNSGKYLAFYQKDESEVADYPLLDITTRTGSLNSIKYPMAGTSSEKSAVGIYNVENGKTVYIKPKGNADDYLTNVGWGPNDKFVYIAELNRGQDHMKLQKYSAETGEFVKTLFEEKAKEWVEPEHPVYFVNDNQFVWISERDGFMNLYLYDAEGNLVKQLTNNKWVAQGVVGHNGNVVYYQGTGESPLETNYFSVDINSGEQKTLTKGGTHSAVFSSDCKYMYVTMENRETPNIETVRDNTGKELKEVLNAANPYKETKLGISEYGTIKGGDDKTDLYYRMIKPADFDANKKYPVLVYVYGGPHAQLVTDSWLGGASLWMHWMANQGYIVYTVDGRGSANRGYAFESVIHRNLGTAEMEDQLKGVEYLKSLPYVDANRLAVHGWSFGGFMTTSLMLRQAGVFNVGVAGGPVTDWQYYEVMYGERYMDRPEENEEGYKENRLMEYVKNLKGKLLLIHGTVDDVVVMQHNLALVKAFVEEGVQVDFFPYPMHKHNVRGKDRVHLMEKVLTYVIENNK
ncbi:S9 family peptidase [Paracrocinitomix mangrovi]|uniref:S9 family peptidase n=1 Tax=Paracrocinitomix mangrovi TaxID=2862509 RepID=UPI001C8DEC2D|nr:S9 family peptidase [Paracrocinitomix mangrovi]UKN01338.1 S9 family peptidase [Paracrocinitomix mangrovi]